MARRVLGAAGAGTLIAAHAESRSPFVKALTEEYFHSFRNRT